MTVVSARVDERLIHGQVATVWTRMVGADRIIVANDEAVHDELQIGALKLAKPVGVKLSILGINRAITNISNGKYEGDHAFLITKNIADMKALIDGGIGLKAFNVGNIAPHGDAKPIKNSVYLDQKDVDDINELIQSGVKITAQMVPNESDASITTFMN
ncbi:PTS system mannose/fructose/N-acetylgalactosamine-transporter subunit IIB [Lacticaseibacillus daqingensis]|uniref:PTS system mannose/fructose/N-acetylgalactosamine-transporter subunit IIB n=1 Tax=Lacticaseibacillus daqingensis TaxID=2486014 RepID=UPI000F79D2CE|nr:PTS sugar transporter subunit IIB [Lacticaseibacillus daqingensis]